MLRRAYDGVPFSAGHNLAIALLLGITGREDGVEPCKVLAPGSSIQRMSAVGVRGQRREPPHTPPFPEVLTMGVCTSG